MLIVAISTANIIRPHKTQWKLKYPFDWMPIPVEEQVNPEFLDFDFGKIIDFLTV